MMDTCTGKFFPHKKKLLVRFQPLPPMGVKSLKNHFALTTQNIFGSSYRALHAQLVD